VVSERRVDRARAQVFAVGAAAVLAQAPGVAAGGSERTPDPRIRVAPYAADEVYRLRGYAGYQIDLEFEPGESFVGLGAGDLESLAFAAQANHLFLKPRAAGVDTNLTVLTNRRTYHFDYSAAEHRPDPGTLDVIYALRFVYLPPEHAPEVSVDSTERRLADASAARWHNREYGYRGSPQLKPESAWDDGVQTRLRFGARSELPALFVRNDDGSESLLNFTVEADEVIVHRVARQFVVRRGRLEGCIVNQGFTGAGERLHSGTVAPDVERATRGGPR
jgi:type IV secretion system protein VirB9